MWARIAVLLPLLALAGCGGSYSPDIYNAAAVQQANKVEQGIIVGVRKVDVSADSTIATTTGAAAGGIAGAETPWGTVTRAFTALGGTVIGGIAGSSTGHVLDDTDAWEYIIKEPNGDLVSVTQRDKVPLEVGLSVLVITGKQARVVPDYTVQVGPATPMAAAKPTAKSVSKHVAPAIPAAPAASAAVPSASPATAPAPANGPSSVSTPPGDATPPASTTPPSAGSVAAPPSVPAPTAAPGLTASPGATASPAPAASPASGLPATPADANATPASSI